MKGQSQRFLLILLLISVILIVGAGAVNLYFRSQPSDEITIAWQTSTALFTQQDKQDIQNAWKTTILKPNPSRLAGHAFTIIDAQRQGDWAIFSATERLPQNAKPIPTEPLFFIAHRQGSSWSVSIPSSPVFCSQLNQVPDTLLDPIDKQYFLGCYH